MQVANIFEANKGNFLKNSRNEVGWIKSVSYYLHKNGYPSCPFRGRIYNVRKNNTPGEDLLFENLIVNAKKSGWFKIDISEYGIPFPEEGAFIMMEWIKFRRGILLQNEYYDYGRKWGAESHEEEVLWTSFKYSFKAVWDSSMGK